jgi:hypothetical protein
LKRLSVALISVLVLLSLYACDELANVVEGPIDPLIDQGVVESQDFNLTTPVYGIQVAIKKGVSAGTQDVLNLLDNRAEKFLDCQFGDSQIGFENYMLSDGTIVPPLSELIVYVVPNRFDCNAADRSVCGGIYFYDIDAIVISEGGFQGCGEFSVWKHELGHRYGLAPDHSNISDFQPCINAQTCSVGDILD